MDYGNTAAALAGGLRRRGAQRRPLTTNSADLFWAFIFRKRAVEVHFDALTQSLHSCTKSVSSRRCRSWWSVISRARKIEKAADTVRKFGVHGSRLQSDRLALVGHRRDETHRVSARFAREMTFLREERLPYLFKARAISVAVASSQASQTQFSAASITCDDNRSLNARWERVVRNSRDGLLALIFATVQRRERVWTKMALAAALLTNFRTTSMTL